MKEFKLKELKLVMTRYPRVKIDIQHVERLADAIESGVSLPPPLVWKGRNEVIDGFHTVKACEFLTNGRGVIGCIEKDYPDESAAFLDAVKRNANQGMTLNDSDRERAAELAGELKIDPGRIASALSVNSKRFVGLTIGKVSSELTTDRSIRPVAAAALLSTALTTASSKKPSRYQKHQDRANQALAEMFHGRPIPAKVVLASETILEFFKIEVALRDPKFISNLRALKAHLETINLEAS